MKTRLWTIALALLLIAACGNVLAEEAERKPVAVHHPNLLLSPAAIEGVKLKVKELPWAARLLERVKAKAQNDGAVIEAAIAWTLTGEEKFAQSARRQLLHDAREQMPHYETIDVKAEPEWGRWTWWGAT